MMHRLNKSKFNIKMNVVETIYNLSRRKLNWLLSKTRNIEGQIFLIVFLSAEESIIFLWQKTTVAFIENEFYLVDPWGQPWEKALPENFTLLKRRF